MHDYPGPTAPRLDEVLAKIWIRTAQYHGVRLQIVKSDADSAFKRYPIRPASCFVLETEFKGHHFGMATDVVAMRLTLPFGRSASPGLCRATGDFITYVNRGFKASAPEFGGSRDFHIAMFAEDAIMYDVDLGTRCEHVACALQESCRAGLGVTALSESKKEVEGQRSGERIICGVLVNVETWGIQLPKANIGGPNGILHQLMYNPVNFSLPINAIQELRGLFARWAHCNVIWMSRAGPLGDLVGRIDDSAT